MADSSDHLQVSTVNGGMVSMETTAATIHFSGGCSRPSMSDSDDDSSVGSPTRTDKHLEMHSENIEECSETPITPSVDKNANCTSKMGTEQGDQVEAPLKTADVQHSASSDSWTVSSGWYADCLADTANGPDWTLAENHFSQPDGHIGLTSVEELQLAIANCKQLIVSETEKTEQQRNLVHCLVQLRLRLAEAKELPEEGSSDIKQVIGHKFEERDSRSSKHYCEKCNCVIWGLLQRWYRCKACGFCCHAACLNLITRTCANILVTEGSTYILDICPERGLSAQNYHCQECRSSISYQSGFNEARRCDYTGNYYCEMCHWNDSLVLPSHVLHNWDFEPYKVCRASKQFLRILYKRAVIRIQDINPMLFSYVEELNDVKRLREELLIMKGYFLSCQDALNSKLLLQLRDRQHFVENSDMYSLKDLVDVATDVLLPELARIHAAFAQHIKTDCQLCQAKGYMCELCDIKEVLFPFDNIAVVCSKCSAVLHRHCFVHRNRSCPRCERIKQRFIDTCDEALDDT